MRHSLLSLVVVLISSSATCAQEMLHAMVADSATLQPMSNVNVSVKGGAQLAITDIRGHFSIIANDRDTLVFSFVGYYKKAKTMRWMKEVGIVFLTEEQKVLKPIVIDARKMLPYLPKLPPTSPWKNATQDEQTLNTPGSPTVQTFGPGYVLSGPISRFSKYEKERKKLKKVREENYRSKDYVSIVNAPEVKGKIMEDYAISEQKYFELLAVFNEKNRDIIYQLEETDLVALLILFYAENTGKK